MFIRRTDMYMFSGCELIDTENISLPSQDIDNNSALTWHKIDIRMRLRIGENARVSRAFSPIRAEYVYRILCQVNALLLSLYYNH
jgi:hypothetical protein